MLYEVITDPEAPTLEIAGDIVAGPVRLVRKADHGHAADVGQDSVDQRFHLRFHSFRADIDALNATPVFSERKDSDPRREDARIRIDRGAGNPYGTLRRSEGACEGSDREGAAGGVGTPAPDDRYSGRPATGGRRITSYNVCYTKLLRAFGRRSERSGSGFGNGNMPRSRT